MYVFICNRDKWKTILLLYRKLNIPNAILLTFINPIIAGWESLLMLFSIDLKHFCWVERNLHFDFDFTFNLGKFKL